MSRPNLLEYALNEDPPTPMTKLLLQSQILDMKLQISFTRVADPALTYTIRGCADLHNRDDIWSGTGASNIPGPITVPDAVNRFTQPRPSLAPR